MNRLISGCAAAALLTACGPSPLSGTDAAQVLEAFAAGAPHAVDVCAREGRSTLRNAVRSYGAVMAENGEIWPSVTPPEERQGALSPLEVTVLVSFAAGFVEASDLPAPARARTQRLMLEYLPDMIRFRTVAMDACPDVVALQRAASRYAIEMERNRYVIEAARRKGGDGAVSHVIGQNAVLQRAETEMRRAIAVIEARMPR